MPSTNKTSNYNLSQFLSSDKLTAADYNSDMSKIDTAVGDNAANISLLAFEPWKTATLQNGWTGTLQYSKSAIGLVKVVASLLSPSTISARQVISTLPSGYTPQGAVTISAYNASVGRILLFGKMFSSGNISLEYEIPSGAQNIASSTNYDFSFIFTTSP